MAEIQDILQFVGVFVSFSIAYVSYRGVKETDSSSLLRLATAFVFLGVGFSVEGIVGLSDIFPAINIYATAMVVAGLLFETTGYFFLAFSHALDVMLAKRLGIAMMIFPVVRLTGGQLTDILSILSFYFVLYGVVETFWAYSHSRKPDTLIIGTGLSLLAVGIFFQWLSIVYPAVNLLSLVEIIMKEMGLLTLFIPVLQFAVGRETPLGTV